MQSFSSRIWTRVAVFISYDDNHYITGTSKLLYNELCRPSRSQRGNQRKRKERHVLRSCLWIRNAEKHEGYSDTDCNWRTWNSSQNFEKGQEDFEIEGPNKPLKLERCWYRPEYWEVSWWREETCCHSDFSENPPANAVVKIRRKEDYDDTNYDWCFWNCSQRTRGQEKLFLSERIETIQSIAL